MEIRSDENLSFINFIGIKTFTLVKVQVFNLSLSLFNLISLSRTSAIFADISIKNIKISEFQINRSLSLSSSAIRKNYYNSDIFDSDADSYSPSRKP